MPELSHHGGGAGDQMTHDRAQTGRAGILAMATVPKRLRRTTFVAAAVGALTGALTGAIGIGLAVSTPVGLSPVSVLVILLVASVCGGAVGALLATRRLRDVEQPLDRLVRYVREEGELALSGQTAAGPSIANGADLPDELRELGVTVHDLLQSLTERNVDLENAVEETRAAEETLRTLVDDSPYGTLLFDGDRLVMANPAAAELLSATRDELVGRTVGQLLDRCAAVDEEDRVITVDRLLALAEPGPATVRISCAGQSERWLSVRLVRHGIATPARILVSLRDITEERRLQAVRNEIVTLVSHDLRAPLAVIVGYLDILRRPMAEEKRLAALDAAKLSAGRMADLLEDLLSATRAEELLQPVSLAPLSLSDLAEETVATLVPTHTDREISCISGCTRPIVTGDETRLRRMLVNLVTNAFKYSPPGTPVTVRVECAGDRALLAVEDAGPGVPEAERGHIFERFARLERGDRRSQGLGLGLYIVRVVAENHGGTVRVEDSPQGGARFVVDLPVADTEEAAATEDDPSAGSAAD